MTPRILGGAVAAALAAPALAGTPDAAEILRRAEEVRSPALDYAVDFTLVVRAPATVWKERRAEYTMVAHGKDHSLVLMRLPRQFYPGTLLIEKGYYWLLLPRAQKPLQLSPHHVVNGDVSNGDLARGNLVWQYEPRLDGEETIEGEPCFRLELLRKNNLAHYARIRCWIASKRFLPRKFEYYGETGALLKEARYQDYREGPIGLRPMRIEVTNGLRPGETTTMLFANLRRFDASPLAFTREGLAAFRDAALAIREGPDDQATAEEVAAAVAASSS